MADCSKCARIFLTEWPIICQIVDCPQASVQNHREQRNTAAQEMLLAELQRKFDKPVEN